MSFLLKLLIALLHGVGPIYSTWLAVALFLDQSHLLSSQL